MQSNMYSSARAFNEPCLISIVLGGRARWAVVGIHHRRG